MPLDIGYGEFALGAIYHTRTRGGTALRACFQFLNNSVGRLERVAYNVRPARWRWGTLVRRAAAKWACSRTSNAK